MGKTNLDLASIIELMRLGRVPLIPPEEAFLEKIDRKDFSEVKLTKKDMKAIDSFLNRLKLGLGNEDDEEFEIGDPDDYRVIIVPGVPIPVPDEYETVPTRPIKIPQKTFSSLRLGLGNEDDAEFEIGDPDGIEIKIVNPNIITIPSAPSTTETKVGFRGYLN